MLNRRIKDMLSGMLIGSVLLSGVAYGASKSIEVDALPLKYYFNKEEKALPKGQEGFIYNGQSYVPLRFVAESLGHKVRWDGSTQSVYIGEENQQITVRTDAAYPPFEEQGDGTITGFDIELIQAIAEVEGLDIRIQHTAWDELFASIAKEEDEIAISAITMNEPREQHYDFSQPYFSSKPVVAVSHDITWTTLGDLKGKKIGVQTGTNGQSMVEQNLGKGYSGAVQYEELSKAIDDLQKGKIDAVAGDQATILHAMQKSGKTDFKFKLLADPTIKADSFGIMVKKGNSQLLQKINHGLETIQKNGTLDRIYQKYFPQVEMVELKSKN